MQHNFYKVLAMVWWVVYHVTLVLCDAMIVGTFIIPNISSPLHFDGSRPFTIKLFNSKLTNTEQPKVDVKSIKQVGNET